MCNTLGVKVGLNKTAQQLEFGMPSLSECKKLLTQRSIMRCFIMIFLFVSKARKKAAFVCLQNEEQGTGQHTATCKINGNRSDGVPVVNWYKSAVENRWKLPFILQVAVWVCESGLSERADSPKEILVS